MQNPLDTIDPVQETRALPFSLYFTKSTFYLIINHLMVNYCIMYLRNLCRHGIDQTTLLEPHPASNVHFRTQTGGKEVDIVLEDAAGRIVGIEVKAAHTIKAGDLAGLKLLAQETQDRFVRGIVLYTGTQPVPFDNHLTAVPVSTLWKP